MATPYVNLVKMADSTVSRSNSDIFELHVHIVFGYHIGKSAASLVGPARNFEGWGLETPREKRRDMVETYLL